MTDVLALALPWDVLREIAFICPLETCTTLMHTCTFFYHEAAASILGHKITLCSTSITARFLNFLHAGKKPRYPCVRHLLIDLLQYDHPPPSPESAKVLADAIALMTGLKAVDIAHGEAIMHNWPAIAHAVASVPSLRQISIWEVGPRSSQWLLSLQSANIRKIKLIISDHEPEQEMVGERLSAPSLSSHPVQLFGRWTSTLTELHYISPHPPAVQYTPRQEVYPTMRTLWIHHGGRIDPSPYIRAFPNLAHLHVHCTSRIYGAEYEDRTSNIRRQREIPLLGPAPQRPGWQELIQFNGSLSDLYALALNSHISHIKLDNYMYETPLPPLSTVLADARPLHLNTRWWPRNPTNSLPPILQTQGASRLQSLVVSCQIYGVTPLDSASALSSLAASLAMLPGPFRRLRLGIVRPGDLELDKQSLSEMVGPSTKHRLTIAVANGDAETILQTFVEAIPTLEDVLVRYREREARFERGGAVMRIGGTSVTDDPLDCDMFDLDD